MAVIDDILQDVQDESTLEDSAVTLLGNYHDQVIAAAGDQAKLEQIKAGLETNKAKIAAALTANTPAAATTTATTTTADGSNSTGSNDSAGSGSTSSATS